MKRFIKWVNLIGKQKGRQASFWIVLVVSFLLILLWQRQSTEPMEGVQVSVYLEPAEGEQQRQLQQMVREKLLQEEQNPLFHITLEADIDVCRDKVAKSQAECAFVIPHDIGVRMLEQDTTTDKQRITVYQSPSSSLAPIVQERIYAILFEVYAGELFSRYVTETPELKADATEAWEAYQKRLGDGSTFHFAYETVETEPEQGITEGTETAEAIRSEAFHGKPTLLKARVLYGFLLYLMLWIGVLDWNRDKERCRYYFSGQPVIGFLGGAAEMLLPVILTLLPGFLIGSLLPETGIRVALLPVLVYVLILWGYGLIVQFLLPKRQWLTAAMPVLLLATLVFSPVIIDLSDYIPAWKTLQACFPLTWWIRWG